MKKKLLCILICLCAFAIAFSIGAMAADTIENVDMSITYPAHLATPDTILLIHSNACQIDTSVNTDGYKNGLSWRNNTKGRFMTANETFVGGDTYELSICLVSKDGYVFAASYTTASVNMETASVAVQDSHHARVTYTVKADILFINYVTVTGLDTPKAGEQPDYNISVQENTCTVMDDSSTFGYKNGIGWLDTENPSQKIPVGTTFIAGHEYQVDFYIEAKAGYEFPKNVQVTVNGKSVTPVQNSGSFIAIATSYVATHTHSPSEWRTTQVYHYNVCTICGDMLDQQDHTGGVATCSEKGKCTVCGYAYIEENENHTPDTSRWLARIDMYHFHACRDCGAHCDVEDHRWSPRYHSLGASGHAYQCADCKGYSIAVAHTPGPAATATTPQTCTECGYIITPAKNHVHDLSKIPQVPATCTEEGNIEYYVCTGCMDCFTDSGAKNKIPETMSVKVGALGHTTSDDWKRDEMFHWRICTTCNTVLDETKMAHEMADGKCTTCGYSLGDSLTDSPETTTSPTDETDTTAPSAQDTDNADTTTSAAEQDGIKTSPVGGVSRIILWIGVAVISILILGAVGVIILCKISKSKSK